MFASPVLAVPLVLAGWRGGHLHRAVRLSHLELRGPHLAVVLLAEAWASNGHLVDAGLGDDVADRLQQGAKIEPRQLEGARQVGDKWRRELRALIERIGPVVIPTLAADPPLLEDAGRTGRLRYTLPVNLAGFPALTLPVPGATLPVGLQIIGLPHSEAMLLGTGEQIQNTSGPL